jgi:hypothetical protein
MQKKSKTAPFSEPLKVARLNQQVERRARHRMNSDAITTNHSRLLASARLFQSGRSVWISAFPFCALTIALPAL